MAEDTSRERMRRITESYHNALNTQKQGYDETNESVRHDSMLAQTKLRADAEHEKRMQLLDLQGRNRTMMVNYENRLGQVKEEKESELNKQHVMHEKEMREVLRRTKESIDLQQTQHTKDLEAKDAQMKEKLKNQEEAFRDQIDRLRRTNELALKTR